MSTTKGTEELNEQGAIETKVETTDYRSPAGEDREPTKEKVGVVHLTRNKGSGGVLASAANAVSKTLQSGKDTVWGSSKK
ncbi:D-3-phosphoglycerate dehydrogenase [Melia azedarach]|uniref:D-3-phosphoglycerate dehydrogenase n=1 Tax=Melia azedarach TaxID=155640 RepID=A0ACC1WS67_MELAZ|nr:D-3-phosphoglycerate dehydrogenase [Melia azedarach]